MNPPTTSRNTNPAGHYVPRGSVGVVSGAGGGGGGGGLYLDAYEVSFPYDERMDRTPGRFHLNQSQHMMEEPQPVVLEPSPQYSPFMLISNLRTHLYVSLEKNAWLQKRIEELEEERNFLRCQMSCFISNMRGHSSQDDLQHGVSVKEQPASSPSPPSPMTTRSGMTLKRRALPRPRRSSAAAVPVKQEYYAEEEYMEEEETVDEEEEDSSVEKGQRKKSRCSREPMMRRVFRITHGRERQRVKDPDGVLMRYKKILSTYQRVRSMSRAFQVHGVDRNTMASTSPIAELLLVAPEKVAEVGEFEASKEKLLDYARRCYKAMDEQTHLHVQAMKKTHKLLPISYRFRN